MNSLFGYRPLKVCAREKRFSLCMIVRASRALRGAQTKMAVDIDRIPWGHHISCQIMISQFTGQTMRHLASLSRGL